MRFTNAVCFVGSGACGNLGIQIGGTLVSLTDGGHLVLVYLPWTEHDLLLYTSTFYYKLKKKKLFPTLLIYYIHQVRKHDTQLINITVNNANKYLILNICNLINFSDGLLIFRLLCDISGRI